MAAFRNGESIGRKSSVYNPTGQTYFQQLAAYNHMSAHLRRVLLAPCVVDSRNKRYMRDRGLDCGRLSGRSKSLDKLRAQDDIIDGIAYDTEHHPLDVLRMNLECRTECDLKFNEAVKTCTRCNNCSARSRGRAVPGSTVASRMATNFEADVGTCPCWRSYSCKTYSTRAPKHVPPEPSRLGGIPRRVTAPPVANRSEWKRSGIDRNQSPASAKPRNNVEEAEPSYSYASSFESSSVNSSAPGSPVIKKTKSRRDNQDESSDGGRTNKLLAAEERVEEAKYAQFIYDITQEIMDNGLYADDELNATFKKHIDMNSDTLNRNKMQSEIHQLKMSLNMPERSDDEEDNDIERLMNSGRFAKLSPEKLPTPPKVPDDNKLVDRLRNHEAFVHFDKTCSPRSTHGNSSVIHVDPNPELCITERDLLLTLMEMKLEPRQIQSICESLQNKSKEATLSQSVQVDSEAFSSRRRFDRANSPISPRNRIRATDFHRYRDQLRQAAARGPEKTQLRQSRYSGSYTNARYGPEKSQAEFKPERATQASLDDSQGDRKHTVGTSRSLNGISDVSVKLRSIRSSEKRTNEGKIINESSLMSERPPCDGLRTLPRHAAVKSRQNRSEVLDEEKVQENMAKINASSSTGRAKNRDGDGASVKSGGNESEGEQKVNVRRGGEDDALPVLKLDAIRDTKKKEDLEKTDKASKLGKANIKIDLADSEELDISFVSYSEFLNNLRGNDNISLPDISERSEGITDNLEEILTIGSPIASQRSEIEEITDNDLDNLYEHICREDATVNIGESSTTIALEIIKASQQTLSLPEVSEGEAQNEMSKFKDKLSPSSILEGSEFSENDEDPDENKQVVVAALEPILTSEVLPKAPSPRPNGDVDEEKAAGAKKITFSPKLTPRTPTSLKDESHGSSERTNAKAATNTQAMGGDHRPKSSKITRTTYDNGDKNEIESINTKLEQMELLISTSEMLSDEQIKEGKASSRSKKSKAEDENKGSPELYDCSEQANRSPITRYENSKNKVGIFNTEKCPSNSERKLQKHKEIESSKEQKEKKSIGSTRFSRLIGRGNRPKNVTLQSGASVINGEQSRTAEDDKKLRRTRFLHEPMPIASDIEFLSKHSPDDSTELSIGALLDFTGRQDEFVASNLRQIEGNVAKSSSLSNPNPSTHMKEELISRSVSRMPAVSRRHPKSNQSVNSISKRLKSAMRNVIKRGSKSSQSWYGSIKVSSTQVSSAKKIDGLSGGEFSGQSSPLSEHAEAKLPFASATRTQNSKCICILTSKLSSNHKTGNCRADCQGWRFICDPNCYM